MLSFQLSNFIKSLLLLIVLILIALFVHDSFVRPFIGDVLVVIWLYYLAKSFIKIAWQKLAVGVLIFSYAVEISQYLNLVELIGLQDYRIARIIIGSTFDWLDLLAYSIGILIVCFIEMRAMKQLK